MFYVSFPMQEAHSGHPSGVGIGGFVQKMNDKVAKKIAEIVGDGITEIAQVQTCCTKEYV